MDDASAVRGFERAGDLSRDDEGFVERQAAPALTA